MPESPLERLLDALDRLDVEAMVALLAPQAQLLTADGRYAEGREAVRELLSDLVGELRATTHRITAHWHPDNVVWIAEIDATYELSDWLQTRPLPRAFIVRAGPEGITQLHVYGAHEAPLADHDEHQGRTLIGGRWMPSL